MSEQLSVQETVVDKLHADVRVWARIWGRRPGAALCLRLVLLEPGFQLALSIRAQEILTKVPIFGRLVRRVVWYATTVWIGSDVDPQAEIGGGVYFPHPLGIVIGGATRIGRNVSILQGVTLGRGDRGKECPIIADNASVLAGAKVIGAVLVGEGAVVGANAVVLHDVPSDCIAVGVPARIFKRRQSPNEASHNPHAAPPIAPD